MKKITILPEKLILEAQEGSNLLELLLKEGYYVDSPCGGLGLCGKCKVMIDNIMKPACNIKIEKDISVLIPEMKEIAIKDKIKSKCKITLKSGVEKYFLDLEKPSSIDQRPDTLRIKEKFCKNVLFPLNILQKMPNVLRENDFNITATLYDNYVIGLEGGDRRDCRYGLAIDIGTTTIVIYLINLATGEDINITSFTNPQVNYGSDVISRIHYVQKNKEKGLDELKNAVVYAINSQLEQICSFLPEHIYKVSIAGNPTMIQLFLGLDPLYIDKAPYIPILRDAMFFKASDVGININPEAVIEILPSISAYVGSDITAGILATGLHKSIKNKLLIDIGTNGEIVLGNKDRIISCSTAAGPAFEGASIEMGMRARYGAIYRVNMDNNLTFESYGKPSGICGSGLVDIIGQLCKEGFIDNSGRLTGKSGHPLCSGMFRNGNVNCFSITEDIYITQKDIREVQLAKGAIRAGIEILLKTTGIKADDIQTVYLAGAFGNFLSKENVRNIGLIPHMPLNKIESSGNTAGAGGKLCLLNRDKLGEIQRIAEKTEYIELSYRDDFNREFIKHMSFPKV